MLVVIAVRGGCEARDDRWKGSGAGGPAGRAVAARRSAAGDAARLDRALLPGLALSGAVRRLLRDVARRARGPRPPRPPRGAARRLAGVRRDLRSGVPARLALLD